MLRGLQNLKEDPAKNRISTTDDTAFEVGRNLATTRGAVVFAYYVRNTYLENNLRVPHKLTMCGVKVDLSRIKLPTFILASREDHIVPWKTAYQTTQLVGGDITFVLAASGHIAGVINPPAQNRRLYWENTELPQDADKWLAQAREHPGSWWNHWSDWLAGHGGKRVRARKQLGSLTHPPLEPAPGRYVKAKAPSADPRNGSRS